MSDNTIPPGVAIPLVHDWCPADRPYPESYTAALAQDPALCVATDPCSDDGQTTLWMMQPCTTPTTIVAVGEPPTLPATGLDIATPLWGAAFVIAGVAMLRYARRGV